MENTRGTEDPAAVPVSGKSPATGPKGGPTFGTKLSQHTHPHRISGTKLSPHTHPHRISGIKLSLFTRNGSIWRFFYMQGEFYTVLTAKKLSRENFVPNGRVGARQQDTRPHPCGGRRRDRCGGHGRVSRHRAWPRCRWAVVEPGRSIHKQQEYPSQANFACNSPTTRIHARSKTAEYQRSDFNT